MFTDDAHTYGESNIGWKHSQYHAKPESKIMWCQSQSTRKSAFFQRKIRQLRNSAAAGENVIGLMEFQRFREILNSLSFAALILGGSQFKLHWSATTQSGVGA